MASRFHAHRSAGSIPGICAPKAIPCHASLAPFVRPARSSDPLREDPGDPESVAGGLPPIGTGHYPTGSTDRGAPVGRILSHAAVRFASHDGGISLPCAGG